MKNLIDYKDDIYKCSRCGLCQTVCPVYKATLNECAVSRGKFNLLNGVIKGDLILNKNLKKYLELCTGCNACKDFCPSRIDVRDIFIAAKAEYYKTNKLSFKEKVLNSYFLFKLVLIVSRFFLPLYRFFRVNKLIKYFENSIKKMGTAAKWLILLNSAAGNGYKPKIRSGSSLKKVLYFDGCFNKYINNETLNSVKKILAQCNVELVTKNFECCGVSYLNDGNIDEFKKIIEKNLSKLDDDFDCIITDCASCYDVLKKYKDYSSDPKAVSLSDNIKMAWDLMKNLEFEALKSYKISVHKPCHDSYEFIDLVKKIKSCEYIEVKDYDKCCGFAGKFALINQNISGKISEQKAQNYIDSDVDIILTTCPACLLGLEQGFAELKLSQNRQKPEIMSLYQFLSSVCKISD